MAPYLVSGWYAFFVAQLLLDHEDAVASLDVESDLFPARRGHEDLHREKEKEELFKTYFQDLGIVTVLFLTPSTPGYGHLTSPLSALAK